MLAGDDGDTEVPTTVAGIPWWNGGAATNEKPFYVQHVTGIIPHATGVPVANKALPFVPPLHMRHSQAQVLAQAQLENQEGMKPTSSNAQPLPSDSGYDESREDEHQHQQGASSGIPPPPGEYILPPHTQLELGQSLVQTVYPYADPYFGGIVAAYGPQAMALSKKGGTSNRVPFPRMSPSVSESSEGEHMVL